MAMFPLPPEIWRQIVQLVTYAPTYFECIMDPQDWPLAKPTWPQLQTSFATAYYNTAMECSRTAHALTTISNSFNQIVSEFLFRIIYVSRTSHARLLADLLDRHYKGSIAPSARSNIQYLFVALLPPDQFTMPPELARILNHCRSLRGFMWDAQNRCDRQWATSCNDVEDTVIQALPPSLQLLDWRNCCHESELLNPSIKHLRSLKAFRLGMMPLGDSADVGLPHLTNFDVNHSRLNRPIPYDWHMPMLTRLSIWNSFINGFEEPELRRLEAFLAAHSSTLVSIHFGNAFAGTPTNPIVLHRTLHAVPTLQEIAYSASSGSDWREIRHDSLNTISPDIMSTSPYWSLVPRCLDPPSLSFSPSSVFDPADLPALRTLVMRLGGARARDITTVPARVATAELGAVMVVRGIDVQLMD